jgi:hypothetical protein
MPATLDLILEMESVSPQLSTVLMVNSDITVSALITVQLEHVLKVTSVKELALLEHGLSTMDVTEHAQPNSLLVMLVLINVLEVPNLSMVYAKLDHKLVHQVNSGMELLHHVKIVNSHAHNVH